MALTPWNAPQRPPGRSWTRAVDTSSLAVALRLERKNLMLETLVVILLALWLLGLLTSYTLGGLIHILLVIAIVVVLVRVIQGRNPLRG